MSYVSSSSVDLEGIQVKELKIALKQKFKLIASNKQNFDTSGDNLKKHRLFQETERLVKLADEDLKKISLNLAMMRVSQDSQSKYAQRYAKLERQMNEARTNFMEMSDATNQFMIVQKIGDRTSRTFKSNINEDDNFVRHQNVTNIESLRTGDAALANIIEMGDEAVTNMNQAERDLAKQRELLLKFFYYDENLKVYIDKAKDKVTYLERKTYTKKIMLSVLIVVLALIALTLLLLKVF